MTHLPPHNRGIDTNTSCVYCKAEGTNRSTCPFNPNIPTSKHKPDKHNKVPVANYQDLIGPSKPKLKANKAQNTHIVLDLDQTLFFATENPLPKFDFKFTINRITYYCRKRPGLDLFLSFIFKRFASVSVFTAAQRDYARQVIAHILKPQQKLLFFKTRVDLDKAPMYNEETNRQEINYYKPLSKLFQTQEAKDVGMTQSNTIMIDDKAKVFYGNPGNGIVIPPWNGEANDVHLHNLIVILSGLLENKISGFHNFGVSIQLVDII